jgi:hypothetical protein
MLLLLLLLAAKSVAAGEVLVVQGALAVAVASLVSEVLLKSHTAAAHDCLHQCR